MRMQRWVGAVVLTIGWSVYGGLVAQAADQTWTGAADASFHNAANWSGLELPGNNSNSNTPTASGNIATFYDLPGTFLNIDMTGGARTVGGLVFTGPNDVTFSGLDTTNRLNVRAGTSATAAAAAAPISIRVDAGNVTFVGANVGGSANGDFRTAWDQVWQVATDSTLTFNATLGTIGTTTTNSVTKTGGGTVELGGVSGLSLAGGGWTVGEGTIRVTSPNGGRGNSGNRVNVVDGATWELVNATYNANNTNTANGGLLLNGNGVGGNGALYASAGHSEVPSGNTANAATNPNSFVLVSDSSIGVADGATLRVSDDISGGGGLTKVGGGTLILESANQYTGATHVAGGKLLVNTPASEVVETSASPIGANYNASDNVTTLSFDSEGAVPASVRVGQEVAGMPGVVVSAIPTTGFNVFVVGDASSLAGANSVTFSGVGSALASPTVQVDAGATLGGAGAINNSAVSVASGGTIAPGDGLGTFTVGSLGLGGMLTIGFEYDGVDALTSRLNVVGELNLNESSVLDFDNLGTLDLPIGSYVFAEYGSLAGGQFGSVNNLPAGFTLDYNYLGNNQIALVSESTTVPGDFNGDGNVDGADFVIWQTNFPNNTGLATLAMGDSNGDGNVDGADFVIWQTNFPTTTGSTTVVPEPNAIVLFSIASLAVVASRWSRRRAERA